MERWWERHAFDVPQRGDKVRVRPRELHRGGNMYEAAVIAGHGMPINRDTFLEAVLLRNVFQRADECERVTFLWYATPKRGERRFQLAEFSDGTSAFEASSVAVLKLLMLGDRRGVERYDGAKCGDDHPDRECDRNGKGEDDRDGCFKTSHTLM